MFAFARDAQNGRPKILTHGCPAAPSVEAKPLPCEKSAGEQPALVSARRGQRPHEVVEARGNEIRLLARCLVIGCRIARDGTRPCGGARRERGTQQQPVDDGVFVALLESCSDVAIVALDPGRPCAFQLRRRQDVELGRKLARQLGQNRPGFAETDESGRSDGGRRRCSDKQQDAENPGLSSRNGLILSVSILTRLVTLSTGLHRLQH